jgi:hypothetical protein
MHLHLKFFSDSSIFFLSFVWMDFIFKNNKKIFLDNIYNVQYCMMFFFHILFYSINLFVFLFLLSFV